MRLAFFSDKVYCFDARLLNAYAYIGARELLVFLLSLYDYYNKTFFFLAYKQSGWNRKANIEWKDLRYQEQKETPHKIHRQYE